MELQTSSGVPLNAKYIIAGIAILILGGVIGGSIALNFPAKTVTQNEAPSNPAVQSNPISGTVFSSQDDIHMLSGSVTDIRGNSFTLHTQMALASNVSSVDRMVIVTSETKIIKTSPKDQKTLENDMRAFTKSMQASKTKPQLLLQPEPFTRTLADATEINIGDIVTVTASENISAKKEFTANEIMFHAPITIEPITIPVNK